MFFKSLFQTNKELAKKEQKAKIMKFICPNAYGAQAALSCGGMRVFSSKPVEEYKDDKGNIVIPNEMCPPHKTTQMLIGDIIKEI